MEAPAAMATLDGVMRELLTLRTLVERLQTRRPALSRADRDLLAKLLPAVGGAFGSVRVVVRGLSVKQIGQLLARSVGTPINGLVIERAGSELSACLWRVGAC
jgi:hypothetical protein